jgi:tetratricopeptide (TPR) repeat protein
MMNNKFLSSVTSCIFAGFSASASAQFLDQVDFRQEGANAVSQLRFIAPVQLTKSISSRTNDLVQVFYTVRPSQNQGAETAAGERRMAGGGAIPDFTISDEIDSASAAQVGRNRKLVIRFASPTKFRIRAGRDNQSIDIVFTGSGASVKALKSSVTEVVASSAALLGKYVVTLQSSSQPGQPLANSVPASLQAYQVFTANRQVNGQTVYDTNLGYFESQQAARAALGLAVGRFPAAVVAEFQAAGSVSTAGTAIAGAATDGRVEGNLSSTVVVAGQATPEVDASATALLATAQSSFDSGNYPVAIETLNQILNLPPNASSRKAQEMIGLARLNSGDPVKARGEFESFLKLYPVGPDSDKISQILASLPATAAGAAQATAPVEPSSTTNGSLSVFYYGGKSDVRTQDFKDSVLGGLPIVQSDTTLSNVDQKQLQSNFDLNWRFRDTEKDMRFVFRDAYSADLLPNGLGKNRLSALYFDYRSLTNGTSVRVGRQSPNGGGVLYRFDGVQAGYAFAPKWKLNAVAGVPTDTLLDSRRTFYGLSVDAEQLTKEVSGSAFLVEQVIDGETDRRGIGADLRYFNGGFSASAQVDYDLMLNAFNVTALQGTWQVTEATMVNAMIDRRTTPIFSLGNVLFFQDPALSAPARRIQDLLGIKPIEVLRDQVKGLTPYVTQARVGGTTVINTNWQTGADFSVSSTDEIKPVAVLLPNGQPSSGNLWSTGAQLIGTNLYSPRDTHVFNMTLLGGPTYRGALLSYNNLTSINEQFQLEPSLKYYTQNDDSGSSSKTLTAGLRATYRVIQQVSLESELTFEKSDAVGATTTAPGALTSTSRMTYYIGGRYDF